MQITTMRVALAGTFTAGVLSLVAVAAPSTANPHFPTPQQDADARTPGEPLELGPPSEARTFEPSSTEHYDFGSTQVVEPRFILPEQGIWSAAPRADQEREARKASQRAEEAKQEASDEPQADAPSPLLTGVPPVFTPGHSIRSTQADDLSVRAADESQTGEDSPGSEAQPVLQGFEGIGPNGLTPPDPDLAFGLENMVAVTNDDFAVYDVCGEELYRIDIHDYLGISTAYLLFDPKVIYDPWNGRWVMMWHKRRSSTEESSLIFVITGTNIPFGLSGSGAYYYDFNAVQDGGTSNASFADYFDLGYSAGFVTAAGNMFRFNGGFRWARLWFMDKTQIYNASSATALFYSNLTNPDGSTTDSPRATKMQSSYGITSGTVDASWINSRGGGGDRLTHWSLTDAFGSNNLSFADIPVGTYTNPANAVQPTGESLDTIDARLMTAVTTIDLLGSNGVELFTSLTTNFGSDTRVQLFKLDPISNTAEFDVAFGAGNLDYWMAASASDYSGSNFWVFSRTGTAAGNEPEIRAVDYDQGSFSSSSFQIRDGDGSYNGFRWGDYFGGQMDWGDYNANFNDPGRPAKVWLYAEYGRNDSWQTYVGATSVQPRGVLGSVTPSGTQIFSGDEGGPFFPNSINYSLNNTGGLGFGYEVSGLPSWLSASSDSGLAPPGTTNVSLSVNASANSLTPGVYFANVTFRDCFRGGQSFTRSLQLRVDTDASATFRNAGTNPASYSVLSLPVLGTNYVGRVNVGSTGHNFGVLVGFLSPLTLPLNGGRVLLVNVADATGDVFGLAPVGGPLADFSSFVANDLSIAGLRIYTQGGHFGGGPPWVLSNAQDIVLGF